MTHIIVKPHEQRIDHPSRNPDWERANAIGKREYEKMEFESEGDRRDYLRRVDGNPNNVPGLPTFYGPEKIRSVGGLGNPLPLMSCGHRAQKIMARFDAAEKVLVNDLECPYGHRETQREDTL